MVDGIKGSTEVERDIKESRFVIVGRVVNMIKSTKICFSGVIAAVGRLIKVEIGRCKNVGLKARTEKLFHNFGNIVYATVITR